MAGSSKHLRQTYGPLWRLHLSFFYFVTTPRLVFRLPQWWLCPPACRSASLYLFFCTQHVRCRCGFWQRELLLGVLLLARWTPP